MTFGFKVRIVRAKGHTWCEYVVKGRGLLNHGKDLQVVSFLFMVSVSVNSEPTVTHFVKRCSMVTQVLQLNS